MNNRRDDETEMLDEYDFSGGIRGQFADRVAGRTHVIVLEPDVADVFTDSESVNSALRGLLPVIEQQIEKTQNP